MDRLNNFLEQTVYDTLDKTPYPNATPHILQKSAVNYRSPRRLRIRNISLPSRLKAPQIFYNRGRMDRSLNTVVEEERKKRMQKQNILEDISGEGGFLEDIIGYEEEFANRSDYVPEFESYEEEIEIANPNASRSTGEVLRDVGRRMQQDYEEGELFLDEEFDEQELADQSIYD